MTMFADSDAVKIGLDVVKRDYPQFTGKGVRLLQVELDSGTGWANPDANLFLPASVTVKIGYHSTEVGKVIRQIAPNVTVVNMEEQAFINTLMNPTESGAITWDYTAPVWAVECHAYTATRNIFDVDICRAQDKRVLQYDLGSFAACGNTITDVKGEWNRSVQTNIVGTPSSPKGDFPIGGGVTQPYPDYTIPTQWTSIATPVIAASYALLLEAAGMDQTKAEDALKASVANGLPRIDKAMAMIVGVIPPIEEPPTIPPTETSMNITKLADIQASFSDNANGKYGAEGLAQLTDGNPNTKCLHFNRDVSYIFDFHTPVFCEKVAITSANDYPARDPQTVRIYSDEESFDWVLRKEWLNVKFTARFQRQEFDPIAISATARRWRVQCISSSIATPGDTGRGILQIGEMEFWGQGAYETPVPVTLSQSDLDALDALRTNPRTDEQKPLLKAELNLILATL